MSLPDYVVLMNITHDSDEISIKGLPIARQLLIMVLGLPKPFNVAIFTSDAETVKLAPYDAFDNPPCHVPFLATDVVHFPLGHLLLFFSYVADAAASDLVCISAREISSQSL